MPTSTKSLSIQIQSLFCLLLINCSRHLSRSNQLPTPWKTKDTSQLIRIIYKFLANLKSRATLKAIHQLDLSTLWMAGSLCWWTAQRYAIGRPKSKSLPLGLACLTTVGQLLGFQVVCFSRLEVLAKSRLWELVAAVQVSSSTMSHSQGNWWDQTRDLWST